ncbi:MAG: hypothetical protein AAF483_25490 [Planctomycetota bacterium]
MKTINTNSIVALVAMLALFTNTANAQPRNHPPIAAVVDAFDNVPVDMLHSEIDLGEFPNHGALDIGEHYQGIIEHKGVLYLSSSFKEQGRIAVVANIDYSWHAVDAIHVPEYWHLGGMDISGDYLAVAAHDDYIGAVLIYNVKDPLQPTLVYAQQFRNKVGAVGMTLGANGRMQLAVTGGPNATIDFYESGLQRFGDPEFKFQYLGTASHLLNPLQSLAFITQNDGELYLIGMANSNTFIDSGLPFRNDFMALMRVDNWEVNHFNWGAESTRREYYLSLLRYKKMKTAVNPEDFNVQRQPNFAGGGGVAVTQGGQLEVWAAAHGGDMVQHDPTVLISTTSGQGLFNWGAPED